MQLPRSLEILSQENAVCALREEKQSAREIERERDGETKREQREGGWLQDVKYKREEEEGDNDNTLVCFKKLLEMPKKRIGEKGI